MVWTDTFTTSNKTIDVLLVGEVLIDIISNNSTMKTIEVVGGSPYNLCKNLTKLGLNSKFYGSIGKDNFGEMIFDDITKHGIDANIYRSEQDTSFVKLNQTSDSPIPTFYRDADKLIYLDDNLNIDVTNTKILHFTYWPLSEEPSLSTIRSLVKKAKECNALIGFDPNYHKAIDISGNGLDVVKDLMNIVDIIKPSLDDSKRLFGQKSIEQYLDIYESLGVKLVVMTLGKDGLIARYKNETIRMQSLANQVIDSTGAGDAFWSGLYAGISSNLSIKESLKLGLLCSAENLKTVGSNMDIPTLNRLMQKARRE
jgi:fructokinase